MSDKDLTHLIERLCNPGADLSVAAFEAADELFYQAAEIERLRGIVPEVLERLNRELCQENEALQQSLAECVEDSEELLANYLQAYGDRYRVDRMNHMREQIRRARALLPDPELEWLTGCPECGMDAGCDCYSGTENEPEPAAPTEPAPGWCKHCRQYTIDEPLLAAPTVVEPIGFVDPEELKTLAFANGQSLWVESIFVNHEYPPAGFVPIYATPPRAALTSESMEALRELVACEDMRLEVQSIRSDPYYITEADAMELKYEQRRDKAWDRARAVIAASGEPK